MPTKEIIVQEGELEICKYSGKEIRKVCHNDEWYFAIIDVISAMTDTLSPRRYWAELKSKLTQYEGFEESLGKIEQLKFVARDGKQYATDAGNTETIFRIIQSIPSEKAGHFKQWLAKVGYERIQEHQNPSIAIKRAIVDYQLQGRSMQWIDARLQAIFSRRELTDEWKERGVSEGLEFAILTNEVSLGTFGRTTAEHMEYKSLKKKHNLRDNMTSMELILTTLGEAATKQIAQSRDARGFVPNKRAARSGGEIAGEARKRLEQETGKKVLSSENYLEARPPSKDLLTFPPALEDKIKSIKKTPPAEELF